MLIVTLVYCQNAELCSIRERKPEYISYAFGIKELLDDSAFTKIVSN